MPLKIVEVMCDNMKKESTKKLMKAQYNRGLPRDLVSLPEGKVYTFVENFANKNDRQPAAGKFRELRRLPESDSHNFRGNMLLHSFSVFSTWTCLLILAKSLG